MELPASTPDILMVLGIDPGETTGLAWLAVPTDTIYGKANPEILFHEVDETHGSLESQCMHIGMLARKYQGHFKNPKQQLPAPALQCEGYFPYTNVKSPDVLIPTRLEAMLRYAVMIGTAGNSLMPPCMLPSFAKETATDDRLKKWGLWTTGDHKRDATRQAIMLVRRAKTDKELRLSAWGPKRGY